MAENQTGVTALALQEKLESQLGATLVDIQDVSGGCGQMFNATIVSPQFVGKKSTLQRHRLVNGVLKEEIAAIHAWTPKCYTPDEWEAQQAKSR